MNSEELEVSLKTEFESYFKNVLAEMQQEVAALKQSVESELDKQKSQFDQIFDEAFEKLKKSNIDPGFKESVTEHLKLARDEGARITATAIEEAAQFDKPAQPTGGDITQLFHAVAEISSKPSQSEILKSLVKNAGHFAPRGAFFIVKNDHLVGWRIFDKEKNTEEKIKEVFFPLSSSSILSEAIGTQKTIEGAPDDYREDAEILNKLDFGRPNRMIAIPLVARGRGVAVLYADQGRDGADVNVEALETMTRVAGLTVEVLAASKGTAKKETSGKDKASKSQAFEPVSEPSFQMPEATPVFETAPVGEYQAKVEMDSFSTIEAEPAKPVFESAPVFEPPMNADFETAQVTEPAFQTPIEELPKVESYSEFETSAWSDSQASVSEDLSPQEFAENYAKQTDPTTIGRVGSYDAPPEPVSTEGFEFETTPQAESVMDQVDNDVMSIQDEQFTTFEIEGSAPETAPITTPPIPEPVMEPVVAAPAKKSRLERNVDLPIEVGEDERRLHNDARRFARLLVSEIKLYNEQKVKEGRESSDLYERLQEAIDRSREMYDKRVQPPVAAKFDYFHYELVNSLAEGDADRLGTGYPGAAV